MIKREDVYKIGRLGKAHGVKGEVSFQFDDDIFDTTDADYLILEIDGILVPFFMEEYRFRNDSLALVKFCDVDTQQRASELRSLARLPPLTIPPRTFCSNWRTDDSSQPPTSSLPTSTPTDNRLSCKSQPDY